MRSIANAMLWEFVRMVRWSLLVFTLLSIAIWLVPFSSSSRVPLDVDNPEFVLIFSLLSTMSIICIAVGASEFQSPASSYFALPISTRKIVAWKLALPCIVTGLTVALTFSFASLICGKSLPILGVSLFAATITAPLVMLCNPRRSHSIEQFTLGLAIIFALIYWLTGRYGKPLSPPTHLWTHVTISEMLTMASAVAVTTVIYFRFVSADRCGEAGYSTLLSWILTRFHFSRTKSIHDSMQKFSSPAEAQFWYEYRQKGVAFPSIVAMVVGIYLFPLVIYLIAIWFTRIPLLPHITIPFLISGICTAFWMLGLNFATLGLGAGWFIGFSSFTSKRRQQESSIVETMQNLDAIKMSGYQAALPISSTSYSLAIFRTIAQSILNVWVTWGIFFLLFHFALWLLGQPNESPYDSVVKLTGYWFIPFTILGPWVTTANVASVCLTGRPRIVFVTILTAIVLVFGFIFFANTKVTTNTNTLLGEIGVHAISILAVFGTIFAFVIAYSSKQIDSSYVAVVGLASFLLTLTATSLAPIPLTSSVCLLITLFVALVVLPFATIPLAFALNRHR